MNCKEVTVLAKSSSIAKKTCCWLLSTSCNRSSKVRMLSKLMKLSFRTKASPMACKIIGSFICSPRFRLEALGEIICAFVAGLSSSLNGVKLASTSKLDESVAVAILKPTSRGRSWTIMVLGKPMATLTWLTETSAALSFWPNWSDLKVRMLLPIRLFSSAVTLSLQGRLSWRHKTVLILKMPE